MEAGLAALGPGCAAGPWTILDPCDVASQVPAINDEMSAANEGQSIGVLRNKEEWQQIKSTMHERGERALGFLLRHPLTLQQVIADSVCK